MSNSHKTQDSFDKRLIDRNVKHGHYGLKEVANHMDNLPDVTAKAITLGEVEDLRSPAVDPSVDVLKDIDLSTTPEP